MRRSQNKIRCVQVCYLLMGLHGRTRPPPPPRLLCMSRAGGDATRGLSIMPLWSTHRDYAAPQGACPHLAMGDTRVLEEMKRARGLGPLTPGLEPYPRGSHSLMGRGLPFPLAPGEPLHDDLPLDMVARPGWLTGVSGRQLSRPRRGQVSTATADVGEEGEDAGS